MKKMLILTERQVEFIKIESAKYQIAESDVVRRILDKYMDKKEEEEAAMTTASQ